MSELNDKVFSLAARRAAEKKFLGQATEELQRILSNKAVTYARKWAKENKKGIEKLLSEELARQLPRMAKAASKTASIALDW